MGLVVIAAFSCSTGVSAQGIAERCAVPDLQPSEHFAELQASAVKLNEDTCFEKLGQGAGAFEQEQNERYRSFATAVRDAAREAFAGVPMDNLEVPFDNFIATVSAGEFASKRLPEFVVERGERSSEWFIFHFQDLGQLGVIATREDDAACNARFEAACSDVLRDLAGAINPYKYAYEQLTAEDTTKILEELATQWDRYIETARSQTLLDLSLTTIIERQRFTRGYLTGPPVRQWSALHPNLVYDHASDAPAGEKDKLSVSIEWFGVNWWGEETPFFNVPFGISIASVYSDRPGIDSAGHGLVFHFDNKYSIGIARRGDSDSIYVSIDLLKLVEDRRQQIERYREKLGE